MGGYCETLYTIAIESIQFEGIKREITGKEFMEALSPNLTIKYEVGHIFLTKPNFERYTEVDDIFRRMVNLEIPSDERWDQLCETID